MPLARSLLFLLVIFCYADSRSASKRRPTTVSQNARRPTIGPVIPPTAQMPPPRVPLRKKRVKTKTKTTDAENDDNRSPEYGRRLSPLMDPQGTWLAFVRHSDRNQRNPQNRKKKRRKSRNRLPDSLVGPPGPPGPQGPPGPAGAVVTKDVLIEEFGAMIREAAEHHIEAVLNHTHNGNDSWTNPGNHSDHVVAEEELPPLFDVNEAAIIPRIKVGFHCRLRTNVDIPRKVFSELSKFTLHTGAAGVFKRGEGLNLAKGRFTAPQKGIYQLSASLQIGLHYFKIAKKKRYHLTHLPRRKDHIRILICISSLCHRHTSLEHMSAVDVSIRILTVSVSGLLELNESQYASVYVDNASRYPITVQKGSSFAAILAGV